MRTCRRKLLDKALDNAIDLMQGRVLDIGGKKHNKRGLFRPPITQVTCWEYLNSDIEDQPDYCCDAAEIPLDDNSTDTVVMTEVLEYLDKPEQVLSEISRILKASGVCILSVPFLNPIHGDWHCDRQRWTAVKLEQACRKAGFTKIDVQPMGSMLSVLHDFLHVSLGYAHPKPNRIHVKAFRRLLHCCAPLFLWLDSKSIRLRKYINTGYFVVLKKNNSK
jgi:SAM-dependent methyltransferase